MHGGRSRWDGRGVARDRDSRSTIGRGLAELRAGVTQLSGQVCRTNGGAKPATKTELGILAALTEFVQSSICGDPTLLWVSKSQCYRFAALAEKAFTAGRSWSGVAS